MSELLEEDQSIFQTELEEPIDIKEPKLAWIVDDSEMIPGSLQRMLRSIPESNLELVHFQEAANAINELIRRINEEENLPTFIIMDYNLTDEVPDAEYQTGVQVIEKIKEICAEYNVTLPQIVAFSGDDLTSDKLVEAGANMRLNKNRAEEVRDFIKNQAVE